MFNAKRIETIRSKIQTSTLLSDHEKSDWLNLLELMNDKQLGELEEILASEPQTQGSAATRSTPTVPSTTPSTSSTPNSASFQQKMPPLSHIANIPTDVTMAHSSPLPTTPSAAVKPVQPQTPTPIPARPTPSPNLSAFPSQSAFLKQQEDFKNASQKPATTTGAKTDSTPKQSSNHAQAVFTIKQAEDLRGLTLEVLRMHSFQSIFDVIRNAIQEKGYFAVLQLLEASPLYKGYMENGKARLGVITTKINPELTFTQEEFEFMADLLRNMRFNRW